MALIQCGECGKEVSDKAAACPNCGAPIAEPVVSDKDMKDLVKDVKLAGPRGAYHAGYDLGHGCVTFVPYLVFVPFLGLSIVGLGVKLYGQYACPDWILFLGFVAPLAAAWFLRKYLWIAGVVSVILCFVTPYWKMAIPPQTLPNEKPAGFEALDCKIISPENIEKQAWAREFCRGHYKPVQKNGN